MSAPIVVITITGELDPVLSEEFADLGVQAGRGVTRLSFVRRDASMLHGVLARIAAHGLEVLDVHLTDAHDR